MTVIAIGAVSGAPGASSLALDLARRWPRPVVVVEVDPDGGRLAARCGLPLRPGLTELAGASRAGRLAHADLLRFAQADATGCAVVVAHPAAEKVGSALRAAGEHLIGVLDPCRDGDDDGVVDGVVDVLLDVGRLRVDSPAWPLVTAASRRVAVVAAQLEHVVAVVHRGEQLSAVGGVEIVTAPPHEHDPAAVATATGWPVLGAVPVAGRGRRARRRHDAALHALVAALAPTTPPTAEPDDVPDDLPATEPVAEPGTELIEVAS